MPTSYEELAQRIIEVERQARSRTPGLIHSTIEGGALSVRDGEQLTGLIGRLPDGTFGSATVAGPPPPTPSAAIVDGVPGLGLRITWDGTFLGGPTTFAPMDWSRCEVSISEDPDMSGLLMGPFDTSIESPRGGTVTVAVDLDTDFYVRLVARSTAGKPSAASPVVGPIRVAKISAEDLDLNLDGLRGTKVHYGTADPIADATGGDLWLKEVVVGGETVYETYRLVDGAWIAIVNQEATAALAAAILAQNAADSKAKIFSQPEMPTWTGAAGTALWYDTDNGNAQYSFDGSTFVPRRIGNGAIEPASLIASDLFVTGSVNAALLEAVLVLASEIIVGPPLGKHIRIDPNTGSIIFYADDPTDGIPNDIVRLGETSAGRNPVTGEVNWTIPLDGRASLRGLSTTEMPTFAGTRLDDILKPYAKGLVAHYLNGRVISNVVSEFGVAETSFRAEPNRNYRVDGLAWVTSTENNGEVRVALHATFDGSRPTTNSTLLAERWVTIPVGGRWTDKPITTIAQFAPGQNLTNVKLLLTVARGSGQGAGSVSTPLSSTVHIYDEGVLNFNSGTNLNDGNPGTTSTPSAVRRDEIFLSTWSRSFRGDNSIRNDTPDMVQGLDPSGTNGDGMAMIGFPDLTSYLAGSTIEGIWIYLYNYWAWTDTTEAIIGTHAQLNVPATPSGGARIRVPGWKRATGGWTNITGWEGEFKNGTTRGITLGRSNSGDFYYYARFLGRNDTAHPDLVPALRIVSYK